MVEVADLGVLSYSFPQGESWHSERPTCKAGQRSLVDEPQRGTASLRLWCWRRGDNTGCKQGFAHLLPDDIADPGCINVPGQQLYRMRARPSSLLVGALAARLAAEGWRPPPRIDLEPCLADRAAYFSTA